MQVVIIRNHQGFSKGQFLQVSQKAGEKLIKEGIAKAHKMMSEIKHG